MAEENGNVEVPVKYEEESNVLEENGGDYNAENPGMAPPPLNGNGKMGGPGKRPGTKDSQDVCRDYLNGICARGNRCRFRHPPDVEGRDQGIVPYTFCIDFQNRGCFRDTCRFVHATSEDAERYQRKGIVSLQLARAIAATLTINDSINGIPICKEFQTGSCSRGGNRCRYWHVNVDEEHAARQNMIRMGSAGLHHGAPMYPTPGMRRPHTDFEFDGPPTKRGNYGPRMPIPHPGMGMEPGVASPYVTSLERRNAELEKEVEALRRELEREKHRYEDLMALFKQTQSGHPPAPVPPPAAAHEYAGAWAHHGHAWS
uniref:C3H1-type domain-containing protein n=1 Tax=Panagrolaimus sp. JU765 TaxID=591449 RepID=A0AC34RB49_9BILA